MPDGAARLGRFQSNLFCICITLISRVLMLRDWATGRTRELRSKAEVEGFFFASGGRRLAGTWADTGDAAPVVLICHGIGEPVGHWCGVQGWLRERGVSSMVFNYSGYGKSEGRVSAEHCDEDFVSAYAEVRRRVGAVRPVFVLGFSMGSGIAAAGVETLEPPAAGLFLCEAFTSFEDATCAVGIPRWLARFGPRIWDTVTAMRWGKVPVCVLHSDGDGLFPVAMARRIAEACGERGELVVVRGLRHDEPYRRPTEEYWGCVVERVGRGWN